MAEQMFTTWKITIFTKLRQTLKKRENVRNLIVRKLVRFRVFLKQPRKKIKHDEDLVLSRFWHGMHIGGKDKYILAW